MFHFLLLKKAILVRFGISANSRIGRAIQCFPYAGFF